MCGIAGRLSLDGEQPVAAAAVRRMTDALLHRGPDGEGLHVRGPIGLGHRRLAIIDLETGAQPMCNEDGTVWVVFNGEIYNHRALRAELERRGHVFRSSSDTEVIVHLYEELGADCVHRLRGMFAIALWDETRRTLLLARDRIGIKPLYYTTAGGTLLFASEIKALFTDPAVPRSFLPSALDRFLAYYYLPGPETLFEGVRRLEPGHRMIVTDGRIAVERYWSLGFERAPRWRRFDDAVEALQALLRDAVGSHLISDVPVGVLLSGGVDSTGVLRHAADLAALHTFTVGFAGERFADERPYARLAAERFGTTHHEISVDADDFAAFLPQYVRHMEDPVCEPPGVALYFIARCARDAGVKVLLSGEGGDEAFGGYNKYAHLVALEQAKAALGPFRPLLRHALKASAHFGASSLPRFADLVGPALDEHYFSCTASPFTPFNRARPTLYRRDLAELITPTEATEPTRRLFAEARGQPLLHRMLKVDSATWLPDDLLLKADKMTMAASVELRVPLLDTAVLEFAASLPARFKLRGWPPKRILRAALRDAVPEPILRRKKIGFPVPYDRWLRHELSDLVHETIHGARSGLRNYFSRAALERLTAAHRRGEGGAQEVFSLMVLALTHQQFVQPVRAVRPARLEAVPTAALQR